MSDIALDIPFWVVLIVVPTIYWPVTLLVAALFLAGAFWVRRWRWRVVLIVLTLITLAPLCLWLDG